MNELERVREQVTEFILDNPNLPARLTAVHILCTKGIRIECDDQSLPENPNMQERKAKEASLRMDIEADLPEVEYWQAQRDMLKPDSEGNHWVKVRPKGE